MISEECMKRIEQVIDERIRPALLSHNGDIEIEKVDNDVLYVSLLGTCASCGMASVTNEQLVKSEILEAIPEVKDVVLVPYVDPELLAFAQQILRNGGLFNHEEEAIASASIDAAEHT